MPNLRPLFFQCMKRFRARVKAFMPVPAISLIRDIYYTLYRAFLHIQWWIVDSTAPIVEGGNIIPPAKLRFRVSECASANAFLRVGHATAEKLEQALDGAGCPFRNFKQVLDFGCGCGRTLRWLCPRFPNIIWYGTDVDSEAVNWCRDHLPGPIVSANGPMPPLPFTTGAFDLVYTVSVFTHLSEQYQRAWISELHRLLQPGGVLLLT